MSALEIGDFDASLAKHRQDALTEVRNFVRLQFRSHLNVELLRVEVIWPDGEMESLTFDRNVGYPLEITRKQWEEIHEKEVSHARH